MNESRGLEPAGQPPGSRTLSSKALAVATLAIVALASGLAGIVLDRVVLLRHGDATFGPPMPYRVGPPDGPAFLRPPSDRDESAMRRHMLDRMTRDLDLSATQRAQLDSITRRHTAAFQALRREIRPRLDTLLSGFRAEIDTILTPQQRERLRARLGRLRGARHGPASRSYALLKVISRGSPVIAVTTVSRCAPV